MADKRKKVPPGLTQDGLLEIIREAGANLGVSEKETKRIAEYVDQQVSIFDGRAYVKKKRYRGREHELAKKFNGRNLLEVMEEFEVSRSALYRIVKKVRNDGSM